jgi:methyl-accepting chemotaxis protein
MPQRTYKRKIANYLINRNVQLKLATTNLFYMVLVIAAVILMAVFPFYQDIFSLDDLCSQYLSTRLFLVLTERMIVALIFILVLAFFHQIFTSHQICGPLYNFSRTFECMKSGDLTRKVFLRRTDMLKNEAQEINEMIDGLSAIVEGAKKNQLLLSRKLEKVIQSSSGDHAFNQMLLDLEKQVNLCHEQLKEIKTIPSTKPE